jgi:hypothetical protein
MCEAPARTLTLFLESCVGHQDIFSLIWMPSVPDCGNAADRVVFRSAKQDTTDPCRTGHTDIK